MNVAEKQKQPTPQKQFPSLPEDGDQGKSDSSCVRRPKLCRTFSQPWVERMKKCRRGAKDKRGPENPTTGRGREQTQSEPAGHNLRSSSVQLAKSLCAQRHEQTQQSQTPGGHQQL